MSKSRLLDGKVIVVTGAGRGIGRAIALQLADCGAHVVVNDLGTGSDGQGNDSQPASEVVAEIRAAGGQAVASFDSVAEWDGAHRIIQTAVDSFGRIDGVVNNAGIVRDAIFHKATEEDFDLVIKVNLKGALRFAVPRLDGDSVIAMGGFSDRDNAYDVGGRWWLLGSYDHTFSERFSASLGLQYVGDTDFAAAGAPGLWIAELSGVFLPLESLELRSELGYVRESGLAGTLSGFLRATRSF